MAYQLHGLPGRKQMDAANWTFEGVYHSGGREQRGMGDRRGRGGANEVMAMRVAAMSIMGKEEQGEVVKDNAGSA